MNPLDNPIIRRLWLIERLDSYFQWSGLAICAAALAAWYWWQRKQQSRTRKIIYYIGNALFYLYMTAGGVYLVWRFCFAWKGYYY